MIVLRNYANSQPLHKISTSSVTERYNIRRGGSLMTSINKKYCHQIGFFHKTIIVWLKTHVLITTRTERDILMDAMET
jgi:hypothetical protein